MIFPFFTDWFLLWPNWLLLWPDWLLLSPDWLLLWPVKLDEMLRFYYLRVLPLVNWRNLHHLSNISSILSLSYWKNLSTFCFSTNSDILKILQLLHEMSVCILVHFLITVVNSIPSLSYLFFVLSLEWNCLLEQCDSDWRHCWWRYDLRFRSRTKREY